MDLNALSDDELLAIANGGQSAGGLEAMSDAQLLELANVSTAGDVAKSAGVGLAKGAIDFAGIVGTARDAGYKLGEWLNRKVGATEDEVKQYRARAEEVINPIAGWSPTGAEIQKKVEAVTGEFYKPKTKAGQAAQNVAEFVAPGVVGKGRVAANVARYGVAPGLVSEGAGQVAQGVGAGAGGETAARIAGAVAAPFAMAGGRRALTPNPAEASRTEAVRRLEAAGMAPDAISAGDRTGSRMIRYLEAESAGAAERQMIRQGEDLTAAAAARAGQPGVNTLDAANTDRMVRQAGQAFDTLSSRNTLQVDRRTITDLDRVRTDYLDNVLPSQRAAGSKDVNEIINDVSNVAIQNGGVIPGPVYQAIRSRLTRQAKSVAGDTELANAIRGIRNSLDEAMERSMAPADRGAWQQARTTYGNAKTLAHAAGSGPVQASGGHLTPEALRASVQHQVGREGHGRGRGDLSQLAADAKQVLTPPPSFTPGRHAGQVMMGSVPAAAIGGIAGASAGGGEGGVMGGILGGVAGAAGRHAMGRVAMSRPVQGYLGNQRFQPPAEGMLSRATRAGAVGGVTQGGDLAGPGTPPQWAGAAKRAGLSDMSQKHVASVAGMPGASTADVFHKLADPAVDQKTLVRTKNAMGSKAWGEFVGGKVRSIGRADPDEPFNPVGFAEAWRQQSDAFTLQLSAQHRNALDYVSTPEGVKGITALHEQLGGIATQQLLANPKTASAVAQFSRAVATGGNAQAALRRLEVAIGRKKVAGSQ